MAADCTCLSSKWRWQGLPIASHASLPVIHLAMGTPTHAAEVPSTTEEFEVPEYERLRQENLRKNSLKLQELGIPVLAAFLNLSTTTCTASEVGGEGNHGNVKNTPCGSAISLGNLENGLGYRNPKP